MPNTHDHDRRGGPSPELEQWRIRLSGEVAAVSGEVAAVSAALAVNTALTQSVSQKLDGHISATFDVVEAYKKVQTGIAVMDAIGKGGAWVLRKWKAIIIIGVTFKVVFHGGNLSDAWAEMLRLLKTVE